MRAFRYATYIYCVPTARCLSIASLLPAIDMAGYPIKSLWDFVLKVVSILVNILLKLKFRKCLYLSVPLPLGEVR